MQMRSLPQQAFSITPTIQTFQRSQSPSVSASQALPPIPIETLQVFFGTARRYCDYVDPVHGKFTLDLKDKTDKLLSDLIHTPEFNRLGRIAQRGLTDAMFPADTHTRQAHSQGALIVARKIWDHLEKSAEKEDAPFPKQLKPAFLAAALLHDVGHGPFSHTFDLVFNQNHEDRTVEILTSSKSRIYKILKNFDSKLPAQIVNLLTAEKLSVDEQPFASLLSGVFDVDKADYALRCGLFTGLFSKKPAYNLNKLIANIGIDVKQHKPYIKSTGLPELSKFLTAIFEVYRDRLYKPENHFATTEMLKIFFARYRELVKTKPELKPPKVVPFLPKINAAFSSEEKMPLESYLELDDSSMQAFLQAAKLHAKDPLLKQLATRLRDADFYAAKDLRDGFSEPAIGVFKASLTQAIRKNAALLARTCPNPERQWSLVKSKRPFLNEQAAENLLAKMPEGTYTPLKEALPQTRGQHRITGIFRCYFHPALKHFVDNAFQDACKVKRQPKTSPKTS